LLPHAYKAIRVTSADDVARADAYGGDYILLDAAAGGSGKTFDWSLARDIAARRRVTLAGGLSPENVEDAIRVVSPYCVDVSSGVEIANNARGPFFSRCLRRRDRKQREKKGPRARPRIRQASDERSVSSTSFFFAPSPVPMRDASSSAGVSPRETSDTS